MKTSRRLLLAYRPSFPLVNDNYWSWYWWPNNIIHHQAITLYVTKPQLPPSRIISTGVPACRWEYHLINIDVREIVAVHYQEIAGNAFEPWHAISYLKLNQRISIHDGEWNAAPYAIDFTHAIIISIMKLVILSSLLKASDVQQVEADYSGIILMTAKYISTMKCWRSW